MNIDKKHILNLISIAITFFILTVLPLQAQFSGNVDISFTADKETLTIGDPIQLTLAVQYPLGYEVVIPTLAQTWGDFEVHNQSEGEITLNDDGTQTTTQHIEVTLFDVGAFQTPTWSLTVQDQMGNTSERAIPQISLTVQSTLEEGDTELHDIKAQAQLPLPPIWPWIVGGLLLLAIVGGLIWWLYRRFKKDKKEEAEIPQAIIDLRPPHQIAYEELARIESLDLPGQGRFKEYYTQVSDCMRHYMAGIYDIPAMDLTTAEIETYLNRQQILPEHSLAFIKLFKDSDLVKFARFTPEIEEAKPLITNARTLVDLTKSVASSASLNEETETVMEVEG